MVCLTNHVCLFLVLSIFEACTHTRRSTDFPSKGFLLLCLAQEPCFECIPKGIVHCFEPLSGMERIVQKHGHGCVHLPMSRCQVAADSFFRKNGSTYSRKTVENRSKYHQTGIPPATIDA